MAESHLRKRTGFKNSDKTLKKKKHRKSINRLSISLWKLFGYAVLGLCFTVILALVFIPCPIEAVKYELPDPPEWNGPLAPNTKLQNAELLFHNEINGPESMLVDDDGIIASTYDGKIMQIKNGRVIREIRFGKEPCGTFEDEPTCGRPLGLRWSSPKTVIVADAYLGLYQVDLESGQFTQLVPGGLMVDGRPLTFLNDVEVLNNGTVLFTDSSSKWDRRKFIYSLLEGSGDGRLLAFCPKTKKVRTLVDNLHFPNGIQLDKGENNILINELAKARVLKYYLKGPKIGTHDVFIENLPGFPDNIRKSNDGNYWIGMSTIRRSGTFSFLDALGRYPFIRNILAKIIPAKYFSHLIHRYFPSYGLVISIDQEGRYVNSLHDPSGRTVPSVSEVDQYGSFLYLGSYHSKFIAKVHLG